MRSNAWTTLEEYEYLTSLIPGFLSVQETHIISPWLANTASEFLKKFPARGEKFDRDSLAKKLRTWYGNHTRDCVRGTDNRGVLDLSGKAHRRPLPLQLSQAYSILFYEGTPLFQEIHTLYDKYKAGDEATIAELRPLIDKSLVSESSPLTTPTPWDGVTASQTDVAEPQAGVAPPHNEDVSITKAKSRRRKKPKEKPTSTAHHVPKFVAFQQAIIHEKVKGMSEVEAAAVKRLVETRYADALTAWESPWLPAKSGQEHVPEVQLENLFYQSNIDRLGHSVQVAIEEIYRCTTHKTLVMCGGPSPGAGTLDSVTLHTGTTVEGDEDFVSFLGPMYDELEGKFREWLQLTYSAEELIKRNANKDGPAASPLPDAVALSAANLPPTAPSHLPAMGLKSPTDVSLVSTLLASAPPPSAPPTAVSSSSLMPTSPMITPPVTTPVSTPPPMSPTAPTLIPPGSAPSASTETVPMDLDPTPYTPSPATPTPLAVEPPPGPDLNTAVYTSTNPEGPPVNSRPPPGLSGVKYPNFINANIIRHLLNVCKVSDLPAVVGLYLEYEAASPSKSAIRLSSKGRPTEVDIWLKNQDDPGFHVSDVAVFGASWIVWWTQCQPVARSNSGWPPPRVELQKSDWGKMVHGGKNGIFLFVMAMSWWAKRVDAAQPPSLFCEAVADLKWVLERLIEHLTSPPAPSPPPEILLGKRRVRLSVRASEAGNMEEMFNR